MTSKSGNKPGAGRLLLCLCTTCLIAGAALMSQPAARADAGGAVLEYSTDGATLQFESAASGTVAMRLTVAGPSGETVFDRRFEGSGLEWVPANVLADGLYRFEVTAIVVDTNAQPRAAATAEFPAVPDGHKDGLAAPEIADRTDSTRVLIERRYAEADKRVHVRSGAFRVVNNEIVFYDDELVAAEASGSGWMARALAAVGDFMIPSAAADCASPCNVDDITDSEIHINADSNANTGGPWSVVLAVDDTDGMFMLGGGDTNNRSFKIEFDAPDDSLRIDRFGRVGLGTATPAVDLHISDGRPELRLTDTSDSTDWTVANTNSSRFEVRDETRYQADCVGDDGLDDNCVSNPFTIEAATNANNASFQDKALYIDEFGAIGMGTDNPNPFFKLTIGSFSPSILFQGDNGSAVVNYNDVSNELRLGGGLFDPVMSINSDAPQDSIAVDSSGNVGIGTGAPSSALDVERETDAQITVQNTSGTTAERVPFRLINNGKTRFVINNTAAGTIWTFDNAGGSFQISRVGSGVAEFKLLNNGDAEFDGNVTANGVVLSSSRTLKTDFGDVDENEILDKVSDLDILQWRYKDEDPSVSHIGPMAEEFQQLFGLGDGRTLNMVDTTGIAFAAIQGLREENRKLRERVAEIDEIRAELRALKAAR